MKVSNTMRLLMSSASIVALAAVTVVSGFSGTTASAATNVKLVSNVQYSANTYDVLDEYLPTVKSATPTPAVLFIHGGGWGGGDKSEWSSDAAAFTAATGWPAFNMNYDKTLVKKYITEPAEVKAATNFIKNNAAKFNIDASRIGLVGDSAGGHLALLGAMSGTGPSSTGSRVEAVVSWSGIADMPLLTSEVGCYDTFCSATSTTQWVGWAAQVFEGKTLAPNALDQWQSTSAYYQVDPTDPKTLMFNSDSEMVPLEQMQEMADKLTANNVPVQTVVVPGTAHAMAYNSTAWPTTLSWLRTNL